MLKFYYRFLIVLLISFLMTQPLNARSEISKDLRTTQNNNFSQAPAYGIVGHRVGKMYLGVSNNGTLGLGFSQSGGMDFFTGSGTKSLEYPRGSNANYLFAAAFWIGAVVGRDTLVSVAADGWSNVREFSPEEPPFGNIIRRSILFPDDPELFTDAVSEEDYIMKYSDTSTAGNASHIPLNIEVTQRSYAWSYPYADDFILFDYSIKNIGFQTLHDVYMGIYCDADVASLVGSSSGQGWTDDISGFLETVPSEFNHCDFLDTVNIAWVADNDGDPSGGGFNQFSPSSVTGIRIIRTPADSLDVSFNWWISGMGDFGPREKSEVGRWKEEFRDFGTGALGTPEGDPNKYYMLKNREFDYDQHTTASIQPTDTLWLYPNPEISRAVSDGFDTRFLLSFGPFEIEPGEALPISFAYIGGENFHVDPNNLTNLPGNPETFYYNLNFIPFGENSSWASKVYDNPGIDTDGDNYFGKLRFCCEDSTLLSIDTVFEDNIEIYTYNYNYEGCDSVYYEGDGVPDFKGASPPPAPDFWLKPEVGKVKVRFNGLASETTLDIFSHIIDFEGYRIYLSRDDRRSSFVQMASYDKENYNKYVWNPDLYPFAGYELTDNPFTVEELRCLYGTGDFPVDSCQYKTFNPWAITRNSPYTHPLFADSTFFFTPQDYNTSELGIETPIQKIYPEQPYPSSLIPDSANAEELTDDGYLKYFEYEFTIENLLPTIQYFINVTAFDFGSPASGLTSLETSITSRMKVCYAINTADVASEDNLEVYIWPNPYRIDGQYRTLGFEGILDQEKADDRVRAIHFANLPYKCTIKIYSIDGDLIREIEHDKLPTDPTSSQEDWNLITRNTQMVASGLYYWVIESEDRENQIGKLVIIM